MSEAVVAVLAEIASAELPQLTALLQSILSGASARAQALAAANLEASAINTAGDAAEDAKFPKGAS